MNEFRESRTCPLPHRLAAPFDMLRAGSRDGHYQMGVKARRRCAVQDLFAGTRRGHYQPGAVSE
jgi:hypothetical protein